MKLKRKRVYLVNFIGNQNIYFVALLLLTFFAEEFDEALLRFDDELLFELLLPAVIKPPAD